MCHPFKSEGRRIFVDFHQVFLSSFWMIKLLLAARHKTYILKERHIKVTVNRKAH